MHELGIKMAPRPTNEAERLRVLRELALFDARDNRVFQRKVDIVRRVFKTPIALVALADETHQRFIGLHGLPMQDISRDLAICSYALMPPFEPLVICDTALDARAQNLPLVIEQGIRFYAGAPLVLDGEFAVGTLCMMDTAPRVLSADEIQLLDDFAVQLSATLQARLDARRYIAQQKPLVAMGQELQAILQTAALGIVRIDAQGIIEAANPSTERLFGYSEAELLGQNVSMLMPEPWRSAHDGYLMQYLATGDAKVIGVGRAVRGLRKEGQTFPFNLAVSEITVEGAVKFVGFIADLTEQARIEDALKRAEEIRALGEQFAEIGFWSLDTKEHTVEISAGFARLIGLPYDRKVISHHELRAAIAPEFHVAIDAEFAAGIAEHRAIEFEYLTQDQKRCLKAKGNVIYGEDGQVTRMIGVTQDVTASTQAKANMARQRQLLDGLNQAVQSFLDSHTNLDAWSMMLEQLLLATGAEFGFIGEVLLGVKPDPCLKIHAITNLSWSAESDALFARVMAGDMMFCNPNNLIGLVMKSQEPVVVPHLVGDARRGGFPPGHPLLDNYLGIPLFKGDELVGVVAVANRACGVSAELAEFLAPLTSTCAIMIVSLRERQERARFEQALIESKKQAERANQSKSAFLSSMSHELRTPLNAILGFAQLMQASRKEALTEKQQGFVAHILKAGQHLLSLVNDVLNLAKIEAGEVTLSLESIDFAGLVDEAVLMVAEMAKEADIALVNEAQGVAFGVVRVDLTRAKQVLLNLLTNAIKYNRRGGQVYLRILPSKANAEGKPLIGLAIEDTGIGIPADKQHRLFRAFERLGQESSHIEGTGIGLMITKQLIELMGGNLDFVSAVGQGSTFTLWLPLEAPLAASLEARTLVANTPLADAAAVAQAPEAEVAKIRVLYVEDNQDNSQLMQDIVDERDDVQLILAATGELGLELALAHPHPDLILMDINLPGISGQQAAARLKKWTDTRHIPIVALSADATAPSVKAANDSGLFAAYLTKPLNFPELMALFDATAARVFSERKF